MSYIYIIYMKIVFSNNCHSKIIWKCNFLDAVSLIGNILMTMIHTCVSLSEGRLQTQVIKFSFLGPLEFIVNVKFSAEVLRVTEIMLRI
jgi:hypothetical protein